MKSYLLLLCLLWSINAHAQWMRGRVTHGVSGKPVADVLVENTFSHATTTTDSAGHFELPAKGGELVIFRRLGFRLVRLRVPSGSMPPFFKIDLFEGAFELANVDVRDRHRDFTTDSVRLFQLYTHELTFPELTGLDAVRHPFSALSKSNRQKWAFQKEFTAFEQSKYVDYAFNDKLITAVSGLAGDSLFRYKQLYRPSYDEARGWRQYELLEYIRRSAAVFRKQR